MTKSEFIRQAYDVHGYTYTYRRSNLRLDPRNLIITCRKHGDFVQGIRRHLSGKGCLPCTNERVGSAYRAAYSETFLQRAYDKHGSTYDYTATQCLGANLPVTILCRSHGSFIVTAKQHLLGWGCKLCGNARKNADRAISHSTFLERARTLFSDMFDYNDYAGFNKMFSVSCKLHGIFFTTPARHLNLKYGCPQCGFDAISASNSSNSKAFVATARSRHGIRYDYSSVEYVRHDSKVTIRCKKHDLRFEQTPNNHLANGGCPTCWREEIADKSRGDVVMYIARIKERHPNLTFPGLRKNYKSKDSKITVNCKAHGKFSSSINKLYANGCPDCPSTKRIGPYSKVSIKWIEELSTELGMCPVQHAENLGEYRIPGTRFAVDGFHADSNTVFEFHGDSTHGNLEVYRPKDRPHFFKNAKTAKELHSATMERMRTLRTLGYNVIYIWENQYRSGDRHTVL